MERSQQATKSLDIPFWHTTTNPGINLPAFLDSALLDEIKQRSISDTDVFIASYPKSGSTWMKSMLMDLLGAKVPMYSVSPSRAIEAMGHPRVFKEHLPLELMPESIKKGNSKIIYLLRNPKDVIVSFQHHMKLFKMDEYDEDLNTMVRLFCEGKAQFGDWSAHVRGWCFTNHIPASRLHIVTYEDMKCDCLGVMKKIVEFLQVDVPEDTLKEVVEGSTFDAMKVKDLSYVPGCPSFFGKEAMKDEKVLFMREGKVGGWKRHLTVANSEEVDRYICSLGSVKDELKSLRVV